jgi:monoamine oxidase
MLPTTPIRGGFGMARTPLLRALLRLSREHAEAERLGITPAELRERRAEAAYSRSEFLKRAGAVGAVVAVGPAALTRPARAATGARIAIVGGGIAGLTAALTLADKGVASTVYEASNRVGGRMHSDAGGYWANGQVSEFCGELIDTSHKTILQLAQRFKLSTVDLLGAEPMGSTDTYYFLGSYYAKEQADKDFQRIHQALQRDVQDASYPTTYQINTPGGIVLDNMSVYEWIESRVPDGHRSPMGLLLDVAYNIEYGAETNVQSALNLVYLLGFNAKPGNFQIFGLSNERYHIVGGNEQLPQAIARTLPDVRRGWRMNSIFLNRDGTVGLAFDGHPTVTADHVILAMSFAVLRTLDYRRAGFDDLKKTAITQLGVGRNAKLQLQFRDRLWNTQGPWGLSNGASYAETGYQNTWDVTRGQNGATGILVDYTGGDVAGSFTPSTPYSNADTNPQVATYATQFLRQIEPVFPGIMQRWTGKATLSVPLLDPNLLTSYSYWKVGQYHTFSGYEKAPQGPANQIHFAGEHCSQDFQGFMEGGASEGVRAAGEVLAALK